MQLSDFSVDLPVRVTGKMGHVTKVGRKYIYVLIAGQDKPSRYLPDEVIPWSFASNPSESYLRSLASEHKLRTTRQYVKPQTTVTSKARQRRTQKRAGGATDVSRMMLVP